MPSRQKKSALQKVKSGVSTFLQVAAVTIVISFVYIISWNLPVSQKMSSESALIPIQLNLSDIKSVMGDTETPVVTLKVILHNKSDMPVTFLRWSSPLDAKAAAMGIFVFTSKSTGEPAKSLNLKLNKKPPSSGVYSSEDTIRIEAGGSVKREVEIKAPEVVLEKGEKYAVSAKGWWMHVKIGDQAELTTKQDGVLRGNFESEAVDFEVLS